MTHTPNDPPNDLPTGPSPRDVREARADRVGLAGYGCLATLSISGGVGGLGLIVAGIGAYVGAAGQKLARADEASAFADALERAVVLCGFGALGLLVAIVAAIVLLKELGDDAARAARGPVRSGPS